MDKEKLVQKLIKFFDDNYLSESCTFYFDNKRICYDYNTLEWITTENFEFDFEESLTYPIDSENPQIAFYMEGFLYDFICENGNPFMKVKKLNKKFIKILNKFDCDYLINECYVTIHKQDDM
jgi:hypothetical protein